MDKSGELVGFYEEMLSRPEYLIPLVAASFQYPMHYYGMTSASLLEDLFVDASINFRNAHKREVAISRPERAKEGEEANSKGVKGWDYQFEGEHFSHKVGKGIGAVALLWDATVKLPNDKRWTYNSTMVYVLSNYKKSIASLSTSKFHKVSITSIFSFRNKAIKKGQKVIIVERLSPLDWYVHEVIQLNEAENISSALPLELIWTKMASFWSKSGANKFDIFVSTKYSSDEFTELAGTQVQINFEAHPGIYIFKRARLSNIEVTQNNRAVLLPAKTVGQLTRESADSGLFIFMPSWYTTYAENRPADLYLAQKQEFDQMHSASRRR